MENGAVEASLFAPSASPTPTAAMCQLPPAPEDIETQHAADSDRRGAWAAAAVLVISVVLASGAVG